MSGKVAVAGTAGVQYDEHCTGTSYTVVSSSSSCYLVAIVGVKGGAGGGANTCSVNDIGVVDVCADNCAPVGATFCTE